MNWQRGLEMSQTTHMKLALSTPVVWNWMEKAYFDDNRFTEEDIDETIAAGGLLAGIWAEELFGGASVALGVPLGSMAAAGTVTVLAGFIPAYAIAGEQGVEDYGDFVFSGPKGWVEKTLDVTVPAIEQEIESTVDLSVNLAETLYRAAEGWVNKQVVTAHHLLEKARRRIPWHIFRPM